MNEFIQEGGGCHTFYDNEVVEIKNMNGLFPWSFFLVHVLTYSVIQSHLFLLNAYRCIT